MLKLLSQITIVSSTLYILLVTSWLLSNQTPQYNLFSINTILSFIFLGSALSIGYNIINKHC